MGFKLQKKNQNQFAQAPTDRYLAPAQAERAPAWSSTSDKNLFLRGDAHL